MAGLALFLVLTGGTALAIDGSLPGQNTVGSADIIDGEVKPDDLQAEAIGSTKIADQPGQERRPQPRRLVLEHDRRRRDRSGIDVKNDSLTGVDIDESSLVPGDADTLDDRDSTDFAPADAEDWHEIGAPGEPEFADPGFGCRWANYGSDFNTAAFRKDPWGVVHLKGLVKASDVPGEGNEVCDAGDAIDTIIFQLPSGFRPAATEVHDTVSADQPSRVDIFRACSCFFLDGEVHMDENVTSFANARNYLSLDGISFRTG